MANTCVYFSFIDLIKYNATICIVSFIGLATSIVNTSQHCTIANK